MLLTLPFFLLLFCVAWMPLLQEKWWNRYFRYVVTGLSSVIVAYYLTHAHGVATLKEVFEEYLSFILLIGSLYVVTSHIHLEVHGEATPSLNTLFLLVGALLSNFLGTTGASMLLIRPWMKMNRHRIQPFHIVFFIFMVSNAGGCLTPIGDPPLFIGYLKGIPFFWFLEHLWKPWLLVMLFLALLFYAWDQFLFDRYLFEVLDEEEFRKYHHARRERRFSLQKRLHAIYKRYQQYRVTVEGLSHLPFLAIIIGAVFLPPPWQDFVMGGVAIFSWRQFARKHERPKDFSWEPLQEVAWIFCGIFVTMAPVLEFLEQRIEAWRLAGGQVHGLLDTILEKMLVSPFYYTTGVLSTFLDNAPTYLTSLQLHLCLQGKSVENPQHVLAASHLDPKVIMAISLGAVLFGGMTYIGNGPNFIVKNIAEKGGVKMPNFFSYIVRYALPVLGPILLLVGVLFLRR